MRWWSIKFTAINKWKRWCSNDRVGCHQALRKNTVWFVHISQFGRFLLNWYNNSNIIYEIEVVISTGLYLAIKFDNYEWCFCFKLRHVMVMKQNIVAPTFIVRSNTFYIHIMSECFEWISGNCSLLTRGIYDISSHFLAITLHLYPFLKTAIRV